jgi:hypothetical protein
MLKINLYYNERCIGCFESPIVPRKDEDIIFDGKNYLIKKVFYETNKISDCITKLILIGLDLEKI